MKRIYGKTSMLLKMISIILIFTMILTGLQNGGFSKEAFAGMNYTASSNYRISVDGKTYETDIYMDASKNVYVKASTLKILLGQAPKKTVKIKGNQYANLAVAASQCKVFEYSYDKVLKASYIWTKDYSSNSDSARIAYYGLGKATSQQITYQQFMKLTDLAVKKATPNKYKTWNKKYKAARSSDVKMSRHEGMLGILYLAAFLGDSYADFNGDWSGINETIGTNFDNEEKVLYEQTNPNRFFNGQKKYSLGGFLENDYVKGWTTEFTAYCFAISRCSFYTGDSLFDYDSEKKSVHLNQKFTVEDAIKAIVRLLDSVEPKSGYDVSVTSQEAATYDKAVVSTALLKKGGSMQKPSSDLSDWNGIIISCDCNSTDFDLQDTIYRIKTYSEWGFDTVRFAVPYQIFFDSTASKVDMGKLEKLDAVVAAAMAYNIHLNLMTLSVPGRWAKNDSDYKSYGEFDLFTNSTRQAETYCMWEMLARRYKDIPAGALSFCPLWECTNSNLSTGLTPAIYTVDQVAAVYDELATRIQKYNPDRLVLWEPSPINTADEIIDDDTPSKEKMSGYTNPVQFSYNFCENPYVYAEMTATDGENIDNNNHSMFKPSYPVKIYDVQASISNDSPLLISGDLVSGTTLTFYIGEICEAGTLQIIGDNKVLYEEKLTKGKYETGYLLSRFYPYATSKKCIQLKFNKNISQLKIAFSNGWLNWTGMDVTLPRSYTQKRWYTQSSYDLYKAGGTWSLEAVSPHLKETSNIMICPGNYDQGNHLVIDAKNLTYTSDHLLYESNQKTIDAWGEQMTAFYANAVVRIEPPSFCNGSDYTSIINYYGDFLKMCKENGFGWLINENDTLLANHSNFINFKYGGAKPTKYNNYYTMKNLIELFQKYQTGIFRI